MRFAIVTILAILLLPVAAIAVYFVEKKRKTSDKALLMSGASTSAQPTVDSPPARVGAPPAVVIVPSQQGNAPQTKPVDGGIGGTIADIGKATGTIAAVVGIGAKVAAVGSAILGGGTAAATGTTVAAASVATAGTSAAAAGGAAEVGAAGAAAAGGATAGVVLAPLLPVAVAVGILITPVDTPQTRAWYAQHLKDVAAADKAFQDLKAQTAADIAAQQGADLAAQQAAADKARADAEALQAALNAGKTGGGGRPPPPVRNLD